MNFVIGDMHGSPNDSIKIKKDKFPEQKELTKDDNVFQLGDFGWIWYTPNTNREQEYWLDYLAGRNFQLIVVPGNHENYNVIDSLPIINKWGGKVRVLERNTSKKFNNGIIYFLERGEVYTINDKTFFVFGGARSSDISGRKEGISWWSRELPSDQEYENAYNNLNIVDWKVDYVLTHTCPRDIIPDVVHLTKWGIERTQDPVSIFLEDIYNKLEFREWHFGHFHTDCTVVKPDGTFMCHYNNIYKIS